ncbi:gag/pol protein [Cucumis melo var. makuwa]|uniref:Gag/pol protein n=1 Tax=Cucumis melo var. makuwa TaxID=1194695 RepID=A0A5A7UKE5_CUCMM|nr:gag/pol protein [Cucumis melo var. makuwa]TYJ95731.1 gag/pol protein [Cucumis melo var. makuwa]
MGSLARLEVFLWDHSHNLGVYLRITYTVREQLYCVYGATRMTRVHILNNVPSKSVSETPFELWRGGKPNLSHFRIWGCPTHVLVINPKKLEPRSKLCQFGGYPKETRGGLFFDPQENRVFILTNATFLEENHTIDHKPRSKLVLNEATDESTRVVDEVGPSSRVDETTTSDDGVEDPLSYKQAMNDVDKDQWVKAMDLEMESMHGVYLSKEQCPKTPQEVEDMRRIPYASVVGSLMHAMLCTRPDICYAVGIVSRYQSNLELYHWTTVKIILKYLRRTRDYMLVYGAKDLILIGYTDSDFQTDKDSRKSTSGLVFTLNGGAVVWRSIKQGCIADSTMEAKYVAACEAAKEAVWLRKFLYDLEVVPNMNLLITLYCDNTGTVANSKEPHSHKRGKHIERKYNLIREIVQREDVIVTKIASEHNIVDLFTKTLTAKVFEGHLESLGLRDMYIR